MTPEARAKLNDKQALVDLHINQRLSMREMAVLINVTVATVTRALRKHGIQSPTQQELREASNIRKYGVPNAGSVTREKAAATIASRSDQWKADTKAKRTAAIQKAKKKCPDPLRFSPSALKKLNDPEWMTSQYTTLHSIQKIADILGISYATVAKYLNKHNIPVTISNIDSSTLEILTDSDKLLAVYNQYKTWDAVAAHLGISSSHINIIAVQHGITPRDKTDDWITPNTSAQIVALAFTEHLTESKIARRLNVGLPKLVKYVTDNTLYLRPPANSKLSPYQYSLLSDRDWLIDQHHVLKKPLVLIGKQLGLGCGTAVARFAELHNITVTQQSRSQGEDEVLLFLQQHVTCIPNYKIGSRLEVDIFVPEYRMAIEYCGIHWHTEQFGRDRMYHERKRLLCEQQNIQLITLFEDEWLLSSDIVKRTLLNKLNINLDVRVGARKCNIVNVVANNAATFLSQNHIQGAGGGSIRLGLEYNDSLIAVMLLSKSPGAAFILDRYATSCNVPGGFSKLLTHFCENYKWATIKTFADKRWSTGNLYRQTGFKLDGIVPPDYYWVKNGKRYHKFNMRHKHLQTLIGNYDPTKSESENCYAAGYHKLWTCGLLRYVLHKELS